MLNVQCSLDEETITSIFFLQGSICQGARQVKEPNCYGFFGPKTRGFASWRALASLAISGGEIKIAPHRARVSLIHGPDRLQILSAEITQPLHVRGELFWRGMQNCTGRNRSNTRGGLGNTGAQMFHFGTRRETQE